LHLQIPSRNWNSVIRTRCFGVVGAMIPSRMCGCPCPCACSMGVEVLVRP